MPSGGAWGADTEPCAQEHMTDSEPGAARTAELTADLSCSPRDLAFGLCSFLTCSGASGDQGSHQCGEAPRLGVDLPVPHPASN